MRLLVYTFIALFVVLSFSFAQMKLQFPAEITGETEESFVNRDIESHLKLDVLPEATALGGMKDFVKGMILLGLLADVSFPLGDENTGFKHVAGTAFSGHVVGAYLVSTSFLIALRAGYIKFATQTTEGSEAGFTYKYEDSYSQIPILLGAYYLFVTGSGFRPYLGVALGVFFQTYTVNWQESGFGPDFTLDESFSNTGFGVVPAIGFYYLLGSVVLQMAVEYALLFSEGPTVEYTYVPELGKTSGIAQDITEESSDKPSYISVNLGVSFPLGK